MASKFRNVVLVVLFGLRKLKTVWLEKLSRSRAPVGSTLAKPVPLFSVQLLLWPWGVWLPE